MFYIIYVLICAVFINVKCDDLLRNLPISKKQLDDLIPKVCDDLEWNLNIHYPEDRSCMETLTDLDRKASLSPAEVVLKCIRSGRVTFQADSNSSQVILLVPDDKSEIMHITLKKSERFGEIETGYADNYTFWSAAIDDEGRSSLWLRGSDLPQEVPKAMDVRIRPPEFKFVEGSESVSAVLTIDVDEDTEPCFTITNSCKKKILDDFYYKEIVWTEDEPSFTIDPLLLDDECTFTVNGRGEKSITYHTPVCLPSTCPEPDIPQDIRAYSTESPQGWDILVNWSAPRHPPTRYNVTLCAATCYTLIVDGRVTNANFTGVIGKGIYSVLVEALLGNHSAHTSRRAFFPVTMQSEELSVKALVGGAWFAALLVAALLTLAAVLWRKHLQHSVYYKELEDKLSKEYQSDLGTDDIWEIRPDRLQLYEVIGEGAFGVVRRGSLSPTGREVAVKMMKEFPGIEEYRSFMSEMQLMKSVGAHPHVVSLVGCCGGRRPLLVAEYCARGDLLTHLRCNYDIMVSKRNAKYFSEKDLMKHRQDSIDNHSNTVVNKLYDQHDDCEKELTFPDLLSFCRQIAMGMEFLALNRVVHRDLAARNILVTGDRTLKIADFGLSRDVYQDNQYKQKGNGKMPVKWMAIESLTQRVFTTRSDVWSFGVVMWEVVTLGGSPYADVSAARLIRALRAGYRMPRPVNCTKQLYELMLWCWQARARERPSFSALLQRLERLLLDASAHSYLSLDLQAAAPAPPPSGYRYLKLIVTGKLGWSRASYERPLQAPQSNHYTSPPAVLARPMPFYV